MKMVAAAPKMFIASMPEVVRAGDLTAVWAPGFVQSAERGARQRAPDRRVRLPLNTIRTVPVVVVPMSLSGPVTSETMLDKQRLVHLCCRIHLAIARTER